MTTRHGRYNRRRGAAMAEFGPVLWMFLLFFVIPFLDLISFGSAVGVIMYVSSLGAKMAGGAITFTDAKAVVVNLEKQATPFLKFAKTVPIGANAPTSGTQVKVSVTPVNPANAPPGLSPYANPGGIPNKTPEPDDPTPPQYNTTNCVYSYLVTCSYNVMPLFNFSALPFMKNVPALGKPVAVTYTATSPVEHPEGLND